MTLRKLFLLFDLSLKFILILSILISAPWYIVNGAAGHYDGLDTLDYQANYSAFQSDNTYGWSRLTFHNAVSLFLSTLFTMSSYH